MMSDLGATHGTMNGTYVQMAAQGAGIRELLEFANNRARAVKALSARGIPGIDGGDTLSMDICPLAAKIGAHGRSVILTRIADGTRVILPARITVLQKQGSVDVNGVEIVVDPEDNEVFSGFGCNRIDARAVLRIQSNDDFENLGIISLCDAIVHCRRHFEAAKEQAQQVARDAEQSFNEVNQKGYALFEQHRQLVQEFEQLTKQFDD